MKKKIRNIIFIFAAIALASSCTVEKKLAREFISLPEKINLQVLPPLFIYKYNHKGEKINGLKKMSEKQQDSALFATSRFVQYVDDSVYLEKYVNNFIDEMKNLGLNVFLDNSVDTFLQNTSQAYVFNMVQIQLDEYHFPVDDSQAVGDSTFYKHFDLNAVDVSNWFELSKLNALNPKKTILFSSMTSSDAFDGGFYIEPFSGNVVYQYTLDSLQVKDIYDLAAFSGRQQAGFLFDYFMNNYIKIHSNGAQLQGYLRYDRRNNYLYFTDEERLELLDTK